MHILFLLKGAMNFEQFFYFQLIDPTSDWFGCVLVISFHVAKVYSESVT